MIPGYEYELTFSYLKTAPEDPKCIHGLHPSFPVSCRSCVCKHTGTRHDTIRWIPWYGGRRKRSRVGLADTELMAYLPSRVLSSSLIISEKLEEEKILPDSSGLLSILI